MSVALFTLGGTISVAGGSHRLTGAELTAAVPGLAELGQPLEVQDVEAVPSADLTLATLLDVVDAASKAVSNGATGVVVTQGTDTLEESAFVVDQVWPHPQPFVLTGAMRNSTLAGPDGPANLLAAARVACSPAARDLGALVVFNDEVHAARWVRKTHSTSTATFTSPNAGPIGQLVEDQVRILTRPARQDGVPGRAEPADLDATRVALYTVTLDDDGLLLDGLADTHQGLVVAGFGVGHVPSALAPVLGALAERIPVVLTSRTGGGSILRNTYRSVGSESDLLGRGLISGGFLDPYKARVLLRLLLATGEGPEEITAAFAQHH
ncbi:Asparaginase/glutaminase [Kribbella flavida DSM 17836]|uniref:Asparaginase/glutaminase n=1 Tax=Kribbella flavida (strain DSM 17836 / JCM 10339 / NBRC 14399) TaxID=479435 RepID=D2Q0K4_KRIFD|nr:asparaginase [Kribbella flavida]ADB33804.1 Asparaginase/glutaminase [Kribbella flavida DSM 17836]